MNKLKKSTLYIQYHHVLFLLLAGIVGLQSPLHPLSKALPSTDSSVYIYAAKRLLLGDRLYVDIFDHKGPVLYCLNAAALWIGKQSTIILWLLEVGILFLDAMLLYKIAALFSDKKILCIASTAAVFSVFGFYFEGGNFTEEYALPCLLGGLFLFLHYMTGDRKVLPVIDIFKIGILCAVVALLRVNMIGLFGVFAAILAVDFIIEKQWNALFLSIGMFAAGFGATLLITCMILLFRGEFQGFIESYILFNMQYSVGDNGISQILSAAYIFWSREPMLTLALMVPLGSVLYKMQKHIKKGIDIEIAQVLTLFVTIYAASMSGRTYGHYAMMFIPCFVIPVIRIMHGMCACLTDRMTAVLVLIAVVLLNPKNVAGFAVNSLETLKKNTIDDEICNYITAHSEASDKIVILGNYCKYYLGSQRESASGFFYQMPILEINESYKEAFIEEIKENKPVLLVAPKGDMEVSEEILEQIRNLGLYEVHNEAGYTVFHRIDNF